MKLFFAFAVLALVVDSITCLHREEEEEEEEVAEELDDYAEPAFRTANPSDYPFVVGVKAYFTHGRVVEATKTCMGTRIQENKIVTAMTCLTILGDGNEHYPLIGRFSQVMTIVNRDLLIRLTFFDGHQPVHTERLDLDTLSVYSSNSEDIKSIAIIMINDMSAVPYFARRPQVLFDSPDAAELDDAIFATKILHLTRFVHNESHPFAQFGVIKMQLQRPYICQAKYEERGEVWQPEYSGKYLCAYTLTRANSMADSLDMGSGLVDYQPDSSQGLLFGILSNPIFRVSPNQRNWRVDPSAPNYFLRYYLNETIERQEIKEKHKSRSRKGRAPRMSSALCRP